MAFLCPVRIKRSKKKKPGLEDESLRGGMPVMGRITGSASIETLVRVGIEKENGLAPDSKMVVIHDFMPCVDDELEVKRGQIVNVLYSENDWVYVISEENKEGFIPHSYCAAYGTQQASLILNMKKKMPRDTSLLLGVGGQGPGGGRGQAGGGKHPEPLEADMTTTTSIPTSLSAGKVNAGMEQSDTDSFQDSSLKLNVRGGGQSRSSSMLSESSSQSPSEIHPFFKDSFGKFIVLYSYHAQDENDLSVDRGQLVTLLNKDDPEWLWVARSDGHEGFVPSGFIYPLDAIQKQQHLQLGQVTGHGGPPPLGHSNPAHSAPPQPGQGVPPPLSSSGGSGPSSLSPGLSGHHQTSVASTNGHGVPSPLGHNTSSSVGPGDFRYSGTELVMLYDYKAQAPDDLSVRRGDWVYADLNNQTVDGWLWAYAPKTRKYGFIPKAYARPPAMTSL